MNDKNSNSNLDAMVKFKKNVIEWYPFKQGAGVLNISDDKAYFDEIIAEKGARSVPPDGEYDTVLFVGCFRDNTEKILSAARALKDGGRLVLAFNNGGGVRSLCTDALSDYDRASADKFLDGIGFTFRKYYYAFNSLNFVNVIFTDVFPVNEENISRNIAVYGDDENAIGWENGLLKNLLKTNPENINNFANVFIVEAGKSEFEDNGIKFVSYSNMRKDEYKIRTVIKDSYALKTAYDSVSLPHIKDAEKYIDIIGGIGFKTIDSYEGETLRSKFCEEPTLAAVVDSLLSKGENLRVKNIIKEYRDTLLASLERVAPEKNVFDEMSLEYTQEEIDGLSFVKYGFWDLIFQNIFYIGGECYCYDQEWMTPNIPLEYILFRTFLYDADLQKHIKAEDYFALAGIPPQSVGLLTRLDNALQALNRDEALWEKCRQSEIRSNPMLAAAALEEKKRAEKQMSGEFNKLLNEKDARIKFLEDAIQENIAIIESGKQSERQLQTELEGAKRDLDNVNGALENANRELEYMKNSKSWKITEPLRKIAKGSKK